MAPGKSSLTSSVVGTSVRGLSGEEIGSLADVVVDASTGRLRFAVVELRGQDRVVVVPWKTITLRPAERAALLAISAEKLETAPGFARSEWPRVTDSRWDRETYVYYGCRPYWEQESWSRQAQHRYAAPLAVGVVLLLTIAGLGYLVYRQGWSTTSAQVHGVAAAVRETTDAVRETSADAAVTAKVKAALALSKRVSAFDVRVESRNAVVILTGNVPSQEAMEFAGEIAGDTSGVREVRNLLTVDPAARP
jgi:osmotically-inducible protein OsmY